MAQKSASVSTGALPSKAKKQPLASDKIQWQDHPVVERETTRADIRAVLEHVRVLLGERRLMRYVSALEVYAPSEATIYPLIVRLAPDVESLNGSTGPQRSSADVRADLSTLQLDIWSYAQNLKWQVILMRTGSTPGNGLKPSIFGENPTLLANFTLP